MKLIVLFAGAIFLCASCKNQTVLPSASSSLELKVDSLVQPYIDSAKAAGVAIAVYKGDQKMLVKSYGFADLEFGVNLPSDASFEIGSVTKQFTGAAILQLAEQGKLNLDDELTKYIKFNTGGKKVTIRQLLSHTSGIKGYTELSFFESFSKQKYPKDTLLRMVEKKPFDFNPGEALIYNNTGFFMLGLIIEKVSGITYEDYVKKNLFDRAGMTNSYYCSESKVIKNRAHGYDTGEKGLVRAGYLDHTWPYAAGSLCSTVEDLVRWDEALHHGKILNDSMYREFITPVKLIDGSQTRYAKGITVTMKNGKKMIEHGGGINGFLSENRYFPEENLKIVVLINTTGPASPAAIADGITDLLLGTPTIEQASFTGSFNTYTGSYSGRGRGQDLVVQITTNDTTLMYQFGDDKKKALHYTKENTWNDGPATFEFRSTDQVINQLRIDQVYGYYILKKK